MIQEQVISKAIQDKDPSLFILNELTEEHFSEYKAEFKYIINHLNKYGNVPDTETFLSVFPEFPLVNVSESSSYLIDELYKDYQTRALATTFNKVRQLLIENKTEDALKLYKKSYESISTGVSLQSVDLLQDFSRFEEYEKRTQDQGKYFVSTGFRELDEIIGGWDRVEELATIIARPNVGKSWILIKVAAAAVKQGLRVGIYSGEMSERKVGYRFDTLVGHISNGGMVHGSEGIHDKYKEYIEQLAGKYTGCLKVLTPTSLNGPAGITVLRAFIEKEKLDILFIDQHSLLKDDNGSTNPVERAANISRDLKNLQRIKEIPIIAVSQMNRTKNEGDSDAIDLAQIAQADRIGQDSTVVIGLSRDKKDKSLLRMHLVKSRDSGEVGKILSYIVDFNVGNFVFVPEAPDTSSKAPQVPEEDYASRYEQDLGENYFNE